MHGGVKIKYGGSDASAAAGKRRCLFASQNQAAGIAAKNSVGQGKHRRQTKQASSGEDNEMEYGDATRIRHRGCPRCLPSRIQRERRRAGIASAASATSSAANISSKQRQWKQA